MNAKYFWVWLCFCNFLPPSLHEFNWLKFSYISCMETSERKSTCIVSRNDYGHYHFNIKIEKVVPSDTQELTIYCATENNETTPMPPELQKLDTKLHKLMFWNCHYRLMAENLFCRTWFENIQSQVVHKSHDRKIEDYSQRYDQFSVKRLCSLNKLTDLALTGLSIENLNLLLDCSTRLCCIKLISLNFSFNSIRSIDHGTFNNLNNLEILDLSENRLTSIKSTEVAKLQSLTKIILSGNYIVSLNIEIFQHNQALTEITLNYYKSLHHTTVPEEMVVLQDFIEEPSKEICSKVVKSKPNSYTVPKNLTSLSMCFENSSKYDEHLLDSLTNITKLSLAYVHHQPAKEMPPFLRNALMKLNKLNELSLQYSGPLYPRMFQNMSQLQFLNLTLKLNSNMIDAINGQAFNGLNQLQGLSIEVLGSGNYFSQKVFTGLQAAFHELTKLRYLTVANLPLKSFSCSNFVSLKYLKLTSVNENLLEHVQLCLHTMLGNAANLTELHLNDNRIYSLSKFDFQGCHNLSVVNFSKNNLTSVSDDYSEQNTSSSTGPFSELKKLTHLMLSNNQIAQFDFSMIPQSLLYLDLSYNVLSYLKDERKSSGKLNLDILLLNQNRMIKLGSNIFPTSLRQLYLGDQVFNSEDDLSVYSPLKLGTDSFANLHNVKIIRLNHVKNFKVGQNTFSKCLSNGTYFSITWNKICDIHQIYTQTDFTLQPIDYNKFLNKITDFRVISFYDAEHALHLNCQYRQEFGYKCLDHKCSANERRGNTESWTINILDCSEVGFQYFPQRYPVGLTIDRLFLDGNNLRHIPSDMFSSLSDTLSVLYLNNSNISEIHENGFEELDIQELHLENNALTEVGDYIFPLLSSLKLLYLQNNHIARINPPRSLQSSSLLILRLENNLLTNFNKSWITNFAIHINISNNNISFLNTEIFQNHGNLQKVILRNNSIKEINCLMSLTNDLKNLNLIDLSHNLISAIEPKSFVQLGYLKILDLERNKIKALNGTEFDGLVQLEKLNLNNNYIQSISLNNFGDLSNLNELYLSNNQLSELQINIFAGLHKLRSLYISKNKLGQLKEDTFRDLTLLQNLDLSQNKIETLDINIFSKLKNLSNLNLSQNRIQNVHIELKDFLQLEELRLDNNLLSSFKVSSFVDLHTLKTLLLDNNKLIRPMLWNLPLSIEKVELANNSLTCDCDFMVDFKNWFSETGYKKLQSAEQIVCTDSSSQTSIGIQQFDASVCYTSYELILGVCTAVLLVLFCTLSALYYWRLEVQVWVYSRYGLRLFYKAQETEEKTYDVFIAYASDDEAIVVNELLPGLKNYRICVHYKDFPAGAFITEAIMEAIEQSSRTLLIFSPRFVQSPWCKFEFKTAHYKALQDRCCRLILILLEDVDENDIEKEQKAYLRTNTYLRWDDRLFWQKLKFSLPPVRPEAQVNHGLLRLQQT